jgi:hypothetical protein
MDTIYATRVFFPFQALEFYFLKTHLLINTSKSMRVIRVKRTEKITISVRNDSLTAISTFLNNKVIILRAIKITAAKKYK